MFFYKEKQNWGNAIHSTSSTFKILIVFYTFQNIFPIFSIFYNIHRFYFSNLNLLKHFWKLQYFDDFWNKIYFSSAYRTFSEKKETLSCLASFLLTVVRLFFLTTFLEDSDLLKNKKKHVYLNLLPLQQISCTNKKHPIFANF